MQKSKWVQASSTTGEVFGDNENCTDPKKLLEHIVAKPWDLIREIRYYYKMRHNGSFYTNISSPFEKGAISSLDHPSHGRCFTALPTLEMIKQQIKKVHIYPKLQHGNRLAPKFIFHMPGTFIKETRFTSWYYSTASKQGEYNLDYQLHRELSAGSDVPCEETEEYNYDLCTNLYIENQSLIEYGCTTPFGPNKDNICTNLTIAKQVFQMYKDIWDNQNTSCKVPCKHYNLRVIQTKTKPNSQKRFGFTRERICLKEQMAVTEEVFLYSFLSLVAEIGGYVGLFLGVSINQLSGWAEISLRKIWSFKSHFY